MLPANFVSGILWTESDLLEGPPMCLGFFLLYFPWLCSIDQGSHLVHRPTYKQA